jgi:hypothetical protein
VDLVQVDPVGAESIDRRSQRPAQRTLHAELPRERHELGGEHEPVASGLVVADEAADDLFAPAVAVDLGRVDQRDPRGERRVPRFAYRRLGQVVVVAAHAPGRLVAPRPRAETEWGDGLVDAREVDRRRAHEPRR